MHEDEEKKVLVLMKREEEEEEKSKTQCFISSEATYYAQLYKRNLKLNSEN